ncbi:MAG: limonene-1,2-epoxide hydrolase family protein [bacterium]|nr:limonene-1,2-epoxide hydrolase family protein [bacterium]
MTRTSAPATTPLSAVPLSATTSAGRSPAAEEIVKRFLHAMEIQDHATIAALLAPDLSYTNVSLPTLRGGKKVAGLLARALRRGTGFDVQIHHIASHDDIVMTERTDILKLGPLHIGFWVCGTFRVEQGRIVMWRDYFDWWDITRGTLRGVAGIALPGIRATLPVKPGA